LGIIVGILLAANTMFWAYRQIHGFFVSDALSNLPPVMLWAWERPEDLSFVDCRETGVAFLAKTLTIDRGGIIVRPRLQPLAVPDACPMVAVVRIEARKGVRLRGYAGEVADEIAAVADRGKLAAVQVDFDAVVSQREFYRRVLKLVRERLPDSVRLSITALASWCIYDDWIRGLPVDEAVPMLFQMGTGEDAVRGYLARGGDFRVAACRFSYGLATDERPPRLPAARRTYFFSARPWMPAAVARVLGGEE